ncbi:MAG: glycoside hydrolase family 140 protein [Caldilineaceae bacterium]
MPKYAYQTMPRVRVSGNQRFLVTETGAPFFWLGDTAWEIFHRLTREEAAFYFATRQRQRFNVIQAVALAEFDGLHTPNAYGETPLHNDDPTQPNEKYFAYVDELIQMAAAHEIYVALLPTWGDRVNRNQWGTGPIVFNEHNARTYGQYLGERYRDYTNVLWMLGGDRPAIHEQADYRPLWRAMAAGIDEATNGVALMTYHPMGKMSTSAWLHEETWLDFNTMQSGHGSGRDTPVWEMITHDYNLEPVKPTLDGEPNYEDHPVSPWPKWNPENGYFRAYDIRKQLYRSVFAGGCGVTYGHHAMWQFYEPAKRELVNYADRPWTEAINRPGANQVQFLRALLESRPYLSRIPDQNLLASPVLGAESHVRATRDANGHYAMIYLPTPEPVSVNLDLLSGAQKQAWWYNPRTGEAASIGEAPPLKVASFTPPADGPDWVLVLDDATQNYGNPSISV